MKLRRMHLKAVYGPGPSSREFYRLSEALTPSPSGAHVDTNLPTREGHILTCHFHYHDDKPEVSSILIQTGRNPR